MVAGSVNGQLLLFDGEDFGGAELEMEEALILGTAVAEAQVALLQDEGAVDEGIEGFQEFPRGAAVFLDDFVGETGETPNVPAELFPYPLGELFAGLGLDKWFAAAEGETGLAFELF